MSAKPAIQAMSAASTPAVKKDYKQIMLTQPVTGMTFEEMRVTCMRRTHEGMDPQKCPGMELIVAWVPQKPTQQPLLGEFRRLNFAPQTTIIGLGALKKVYWIDPDHVVLVPGWTTNLGRGYQYGERSDVATLLTEGRHSGESGKDAALRCIREETLHEVEDVVEVGKNVFAVNISKTRRKKISQPEETRGRRAGRVSVVMHGKMEDMMKVLVHTAQAAYGNTDKIDHYALVPLRLLIPVVALQLKAKATAPKAKRGRTPPFSMWFRSTHGLLPESTQRLPYKSQRQPYQPAYTPRQWKRGMQQPQPQQPVW